MSLARVKTWSSAEVLSASDLNAEFNNVLTYLNGSGVTLTSPVLSGTITIPGSGQISSAGFLGIGMTPVNPIDVSDALAGSALGRIYNSSGNTAALAGWQLKNSANSLGGISLTGGSYTTAGVYRQDGIIVDSSGAGGLTLNTTVNQPVYVGVNSTEVARFTSLGLLVNSTVSGANFSVVGTSTNTVMTVAAVAATMFYSGTADTAVTTGESGAGSMLYVRKVTSNSRSINAAGTVNASGADYAEYERKALGCGAVLAGQIIGFDIDGRITDKWADAASRFGVKTTNPAYVGGDAWGTEDALGMVRPVAPIQPDATSDAQAQAKFDNDMKAHDTNTALFAAKIETARQTVDRIAYSGKCPCNVLGANVGDYITPIQAGTGIAGKPITAPTLDQYRAAVGRVVSLLPDGRCTIALMVH